MGAVDIRGRVEELIASFVSALQMRNVYGKEHNLSKDAVEKIYAALCALLSDRGEITIGIIGDEFAFEKRPFYEMSKNMGKFIMQLKEAKVEKISFFKGVEKQEVSIFIDTLAAGMKSRDKDADIEKALVELGVKNICLGNIGLARETERSDTAQPAEVNAGTSFQDGINFLQTTMDGMADGKPADIKAARFVIGKIIGNLLKNMHSLLILTSLKKHDEHTFVHSLNVSIFTLVQAEAMGVPEELLTDIGIAALLHDIGKLSMEAAIVKKSGKLSRQELDKVYVHPLSGAEILLETPNVPLLAAIAAFEHHLKYNAQGYPARLYGNKLNLASMMIAIADAYDSMRNGRSYTDSPTAEKVYEGMMELSGENFHPELLDIFFKRVGVYPPGTLVELDNNAIGLVVKESSIDIRRPQVEILYNSTGGEEKGSSTINLLEKDKLTGLYKRNIKRSIPISDKYKIPDKYKV